MVAVPEQIADRFAAAWNERNAADLAALFADDADFVNVVGLWWENRENIRRAHDYGLRTFFRDSAMSIRRTKVRRLGEGLAVVHARWRLTGQISTSGGQADVRWGIIVFVVERRGTEWIAVTAHNTDIVPGSESIAAEGDARRAVSYRNSRR
ncbi:SgcJ/EcaC family oxidoreductase [Saccharopolyspora gloriosae]|uniref:SgcJ/EcaC family oxidoreductase n=1 Tax=Saccharopolyspora gloriosae TaxID=455344 RepID=UPI001FB7EF31|nr:SgcJ/EcaC family oxidoreductase [Saccharopolyspora gloriosae]